MNERMQLELPLGPLGSVVDAVEPLSTREEELLKRLESSIEEHLKGFKIVGHALTVIKEQRLYRLNYDTFEEYCAVEWDLSRPRAYQLTDCYLVLNHLSTMVDMNEKPKFKILPVNERQTRPLTYLEMEQQAEAWTMVVEEAEKTEARITGSFVQRCIDMLREKKVSSGLERTTRKAVQTKLPFTLHTSFNSFLTELKSSHELAVDPRGKKELAVMLRELLETIEG